MHPRRRACRAVCLGTGAALLALPAAGSAAPVDLTFQRTVAFSGSTSNGFQASLPERVDAHQGASQAGSWGGFSWCDPWPGTHIQLATVHVYRYHTATTTARVEVGPNADGSGGYSVPDKQIPSGNSLGATFTLNPLNAQCVGARARQTGTDADTPDRLWTFLLEGPVTLVDDQGPAVSDLRLSPPEAGSWYTGQKITAIWNQSDNDVFRGTTAIQVGGAPPVDLGDRPNGEVSAEVDLGADGVQTVQVSRSGERWATVAQTAQITVDRTPPSLPTLASTPSGLPLPVAVFASGSVDAVSQFAGYQYSWDGGATITTAPPVFVVPGTYDVIARAIDKAGNASSWTTPLKVTVAAPAAAAPPPPLAPGAAAAGVPSPAAATLPDLAGARLGLSLASNAIRPGGRALVDYDRPATISGQLSGAAGGGIGGVQVVLRGRGGRQLASTTTDTAGGFVLAFSAGRPGRVVVAAIGRQEVRVPIQVQVRPRLVVTPARVGTGPHGQVVLPVAGRTLVLRGQVAPAALARKKRVQLVFQDGSGDWVPGPAEARVDARGRFELRYRFGQRGQAFAGLVAVRVPSDTGWRFAQVDSKPLAVSIPASA